MPPRDIEDGFMDKDQCLELLVGVKNGGVSPEEALSKLRAAPFEDIGFAAVDHHRGIRQGIPEALYGRGKTPEQIHAIAERMVAAGTRNIIITGLSPESAERLDGLEFEYFPTPKIGVVNRDPEMEKSGLVAVISGGTSDLPVAEEASVTAELLGSRVERIYDSGVSGLHRLLSRLGVIQRARAAVVVAGMEGALASVVCGLVACPVVAVPTSVGYGASFGGVAALLSMLNSCASGMSVVNIDNGFGAGYLAHMINKMEGLP
jgi:NCAIR mutase (PurE)-related protein